MKTHARLGASTSDIWINCAGAPQMWDKAPPKVESKYAEEGTKAHELLEDWLSNLKSKKNYRPPKEAPRDMVSAVKVCVEDVATSWKPHPHKDLLIEERVSLEGLVAPDMYGTVDIGVVEHFGTLEVTDYKHGRGVKVEVFKETARGEKMLNTQLVYYALGLAHKYDFNFSDVILKIVQPRCAKGEPISAVRVPINYLAKYVDLFKFAVDQTLKRNAKRSAGPWCRFCQAKPICKEGKGAYRTDARDDFD